MHEMGIAMQVVEIAGPADEGGRASLRKALGTPVIEIDLGKLESFDQLGTRLQTHRAEGPRPHLLGNQVQRRPAQQTRTGRRGAFHALCQIDGFADRPILEVELMSCRPYHQLARTQPDPDLDGVSRGRTARLVLTGHGMDCFGGETRSQRVVFLSARNPEQGHDAVAEHLVHRTAKTMNRVDHDLEYAEKTLVGILRVMVHDQAGRLRDVGEQDRHELALAVEWSAVRLVSDQFSIPPSNEPTQQTRRAPIPRELIRTRNRFTGYPFFSLLPPGYRQCFYPFVPKFILRDSMMNSP